MAEVEVDDTALKVFGTPERELRRRWLHPQGYPDDGEEDVDHPQETTSDEEEGEQPPSQRAFYTPTKADRIIALLFHMTAAFFYVYMRLETDRTLFRIEKEQGLVMPASNTYGGRWKFFTYLNFNVQIVYFTLALLCDLLPIWQRELLKFRNFIFTTTVFPSALVVTLLFWVFMLPPLNQYATGGEDSPVSQMFKALPSHVNHASHTAVGFVVVIEALLVYHRYTSTSDAIKTILIWNGCYTLWIYWCYYYAGTLPYPLLEYLGPYLMPLVFLLSLVVGLGSYFLGKAITTWSWAGEVN